MKDDPIKLMTLEEKLVIQLSMYSSKYMWKYIDYLESTVKNLHMCAEMTANKIGGSVPPIEAWVPEYKRERDED